MEAEMVLCKIIHGDQAGQIVDLNRPAAEAGQAFGTHRILNPDERPPELPTNSEVQAMRHSGDTLPPHMAAMDAVETRKMAEEVTGEKFSSKKKAVAALKADIAGDPTGDMRTDGGAADSEVAQKGRDEDPRMQGTAFAVAPATAKPKRRHSTASKGAAATARKAKPTMAEEAGKTTGKRTTRRAAKKK
jgi:hypothetical protein